MLRVQNGGSFYDSCTFRLSWYLTVDFAHLRDKIVHWCGQRDRRASSNRSKDRCVQKKQSKTFQTFDSILNVGTNRIKRKLRVCVEFHIEIHDALPHIYCPSTVFERIIRNETHYATSRRVFSMFPDTLDTEDKCGNREGDLHKISSRLSELSTNFSVLIEWNVSSTWIHLWGYNF